MEISYWILVAPWDHNEQQAHVHPAEETELLLKISLLERHNKTDKANSVKGEAYDTVICSKGKKLGIGKDDMLDID